MAHPDRDFLAGVIEGFYGPPWSQTERFELFDWMAAWGLNTYLYAPKDDLKQRVHWREPYSASEAAGLAELVKSCQGRDIRFVYAVSPGLDIRYHQAAELECLRCRCEQMMALGCRDFALLFDDIPDVMNPEDRKRWSSVASAQCHVANAMFRWTRERCADARFLFCPTPYCGRMREREFGGPDYLPTLGRELLPEINVFWTGPEIVSAEISVPHVRELQIVLRRKPLLWDNLHANDYDGRRFYCGPYAGRPLEIRQEVAGLLANPNNEFPLNFVPLRTLAQFINCPASSAWEPREAYLSAMREWLPRFAIRSANSAQPARGQVASDRQPSPVSYQALPAFEDLVLFGDCYYLPHELGPAAEALYRQVHELLALNPAGWGDSAAPVRQRLAQIRLFCLRVAELHDRPLFYALSRRIWELREEVDLLDRYIEFHLGVEIPGKTSVSSGGQVTSRSSPNARFTSDFHLPGTYRGGLVPLLQRLLVQHPDGTFTPADGIPSAAD